MKPKLITVFLILAFVFNGCKVYKLPNARMKPVKVCGYEECSPGNPPGILSHFYKKPFSPEVNENSSTRDIAYSVVGQVFKLKHPYGSTPLDCSFPGQPQPFKKSDIVNYINPDGLEFDYAKSQKLKMDIEAATAANMEEIRKIAPTNADLPKIEAEIKAQYSRLSGNEVKVVGKYSEWGLSKEVLQKIMREEGYTDCLEYIHQKNLQLITAIGMVYFDITFNEKSIDQISTELQAKIEKYGVSGNIAFNFKKEVSQSIRATTKGGYQILVWRHAGYEDLLFKLTPEPI